MHFRKVEVDGREYEYKVGRRATFVRGVGTFSHQEIGYCTDVSMDQFKVTPAAVRTAIARKLREAK